MNQSFYAAAVAASQQQQSLNVVSNNIANVNTVGFKAQQAQFSELLYQIYNGAEDEVYRGTGSRIMQTTTDFRNGAFIQRADGQNYAINGDGFFAVMNPETNEISYTRAGSFHWGNTANNLNEFYLCDSQGNYVLDQNQQPILMGEDNTAQYPVGVFDFANTNDMQHVGNNMLAPVAKNGQVMAGTGTVVFGAVEASNADVTTEFTKIIEAQRSYSYALKMVQTQDEIESTINGLKS